MYPGVAEDSAYKRLLAEHVFALLERYCYGIGDAGDAKAQKDDEVMRPEVFKLAELCDLGLQVGSRGQEEAFLLILSFRVTIEIPRTQD